MGTNTFFLNLPAHLYLCATVKSRSFLTDLRVEGKVENSLHNCKTQIKMESKSRIFQNKVTFQGYYKTRKLFHILYVTVFSGYKTSGTIFLRIYFFHPFLRHLKFQLQEFQDGELKIVTFKQDFIQNI